MLSAEDMPDDNADLAAVQVDFERLTPDTTDRCPISVGHLLSYLSGEVPDGGELDEADLTFLRTARVGDAEYWIWRFTEPGPKGDVAYATVSRSGDQVVIGYEANYYGLSPEQFILGDYHHIF